MAALPSVVETAFPQADGVGRILGVAFGFTASKVLLSAAELGLFTELARQPLRAEQIASRLGLHARGLCDFLDALVAMGFLERDEEGEYSNAPATDRYMDRAKPEYIGGFLEMLNARLYGYWGNLTAALRTGKPQNESRDGVNAFDELYNDPERMLLFLSAMTGLSTLAGKAIAAKLPWREYDSFVDIGCAQGAVPVQIALAHPHLEGAGFDLPAVGPVFREYSAVFGLEDRLNFIQGSFFDDPLPRADVLIMGHVLHDWDLDTKRMLLRKAYEALPVGGVLIVHEALIDDERRTKVPGFLASLNMLIETHGGFDFTAAECRGWMRDAGFRRTRVEPLQGLDGLVIAIK